MIVAHHLAGDYNRADQLAQQFLSAYPESSLRVPVMFRYAENAYFNALTAEKKPDFPNKQMELPKLYDEAAKRYQAVLEKVLSEPDAERRKMMLYGSYFTRTMWAITYSNVSQGQCFECMRVCPVGAENRMLK